MAGLEVRVAIIPSSNVTQKVIEPHEVERYTQDGWRVRSMFQTSVAVHYMAKAAVPGCAANNWNCEPAQILETVGLVTRFLMTRDRDDEMAELRASLTLAQEAAAAAERLRVEAEKRAKKATEAEAPLVAQATAAAERTTAANERADAANKRAEETLQCARKAEADIAKIRSALGDIGMKEILGS